VLLNLVSNAAKFTEEGFIRAEAERQGNKIVVSVIDSGIGIPEDKIDTIFEPFTQVDSSSTRRAGGTGLGLSITQHFIELHGGRIWVESTPGVGSTFAFSLPIDGPSAEEEETPESAPAPETMPEEKGHLILCVDDDDGVLTLFNRYLRKQGYQVQGLNDSTRVVEEVRRLQPFAITLDVMMPEKDGWQVLQELKSDPETCHIPVIMCSIISEKERGLSLGAVDYLVKPILEQDLIAALDRLDRQPGEHRVLVIDDQPEDLELLTRMLRNQDGYEVLTAASGDEGIRLIQQERPDLIVLDLLMPDVDGFAVLEAIKAKADTRAIPIIVVTAKELNVEERQRLNDQVETLLKKGLFDQTELLADVTSALDRMGSKGK
jgi:CheY-like chemotaxis protein